MSGFFDRRRQERASSMRRALGFAFNLYLAAALWGHIKESKGELTCECNENCWCKKPAVSFFRWVFPVGHSLPDSR